MALPTSTIVMAVLTCIPFGLAIRDMATGKTPAARDDDELRSDDDESEAEYAAEYAAAEDRREAAEAEEERQEQAQRAELRTARRKLFGAEVATLGTGFAGATLGMPERGTGQLVELAGETGTDIDLLANTTLDWILIKAESGASEDDIERMCSELGADLQEAWGRGQTEDYESRYWINAKAGTRASLHPTDEDCRLTFERFAEPKAWITKTRTSIVPVWLVGQPIAKLREHIGTRSQFENTDSDVRWLGLGVGIGSGETRFEAHLIKGKVVAITAATSTLDTTRDAVVEQLAALYGEATESEDSDDLTWKRPAITLTDHDGAGVKVTIGKIPDYE